MYLFLTYRCTLKCTYCNVLSESNRPAEMETEQVLALIDEIADAGTRKLQLTGGEPLLRRDIGAIVQRAKQRGIFVGISSNGTLVPSKIAEIKPVDIVFISLDGPPKVHDRYRGPGSHQKALDACHALQENGIPVWTTTVINRLSRETLTYPIELAKQNGWIANFQLLHTRTPQAQKRENAPEEYHELLLHDKENKDAIEFLIAQKNAGAPIGHSLRFLELLRDWGAYDELIRRDTDQTCWAGRLYGYIEPDGTMAPCGTLVHNASPVNVTASGGFSGAWESMARDYSCSVCLSGCQMEQNLMFSFEPDVLFNWYSALRQQSSTQERSCRKAY
jgi:MoaA/NifB/PqqE/SkfB family radical SAM enzyme